jgi:hypothetical protein
LGVDKDYRLASRTEIGEITWSGPPQKYAKNENKDQTNRTSSATLRTCPIAQSLCQKDFL